jgi:hypothetical protein
MYSPDGRWWWNGAEWTPAPQWRTRYEQTPWTRKLQVAVLSLQVLALVFAAVTFPTIYNVALTGAMTSSPALANDPQTADALRQILVAVIVFTVIFTVIVLVVMVVGVLKLWRWLYWYLMITYGIAIIAIPGNLLSAFGYSAFGSVAIRYPDWYYVISTLLVLVEVALAVWMIVAYRRYGNWARRKIVEPV